MGRTIFASLESLLCNLEDCHEAVAACGEYLCFFSQIEKVETDVWLTASSPGEGRRWGRLTLNWQDPWLRNWCVETPFMADITLLRLPLT